jgi:hypothetical protein
VVDISSNKEDIFLDTSRGEEFARRLFDDLNHGLLGRPMMATPSSSVTPIKKRRCARMTPPTSKLHHLLL